MLLEYPTSEEECSFKIDMLYDLERYDELSDEVDRNIKYFSDSSNKEDWIKRKEEGQRLKLVYQRIKHSC